MYLTRMLVLTLVANMAIVQCLHAQDEDPIAMAKQFPPDCYQPSIALMAANWQLKQLDPLLAHYQTENAKAETSREMLDEELQSVKSQIPPELQNLDRDARSKLVGQALERLLEAQLELATLEASIKILTSKIKDSSIDEIQKLRLQEINIIIQSATSEANSVSKEYDRLKKLTESGVASASELSKARRLLEAATYEVEAAKMREKIELQRSKADYAKQIADKRLSVEPIKAKINAINEFLKRVSSANQRLSQIDRINRAQESKSRYLDRVSNELFELNRKKLELSSLKEIIEQQTSKKESKSDSSPK